MVHLKERGTMKIMRGGFAFLVFTGIACLIVERSEGLVGPRHVNLTSAQYDLLLELWAKYGPDYNAFKKTDIDYPCGPLPKSSVVPTSVHRLRPGDIKVVGAMGDSLTAGTGLAAISILGDLIQYRGLTWSGGGQSNYEDQITIPNILKKYNPEIYGFATGNGDEDSRRSFFNVAVSGSTSSDLLAQARKMIDRMKNDPTVDVDNDWKLITILSGNNDLCDYCRQQDIYNVDNFRSHMMAALDLLRQELPRTLVNLVEPLNVEILTDLNKGLICSLAHLYACDCAAFPRSAEAEMKLIREADLYQVMVEEIAQSGRYDTTEDFTVVHQPFFNETYLPRLENGEPDLSYFAPDCFHLSRKGQAAAASALWNNMVEPVGSKSTKWSPGEAIECPSETQPFIFTNINSNTKQSQQPVDTPSHSIASHTYSSEHKKGEKKRRSSASGIASVVFVGVAVVAAAAFVFLIIVMRRRQRCSSYTNI